MTTTFEFKPRTYLHFDLPLSAKRAAEVATDAKKVASHAFYPFLGFTMTTIKISKDEEGKVHKRKKPREIKIASHQDAAIYGYYAHVLSQHYEAELERKNLGNCVRAFRKVANGGTNIDFAAEVFNFTDDHRPCVALAFDIEGFFDNLDHDLLKDAWKRTLGAGRLPPDHFAVFSALTRYCWVSRDEAFKALGISKHNSKALIAGPDGEKSKRRRMCTAADFRTKVRAQGLLKPNSTAGKGIPQGSPISALLSNIYLLDFDLTIESAVKSIGGLYRRYCDDIMVIVPPEHEERIMILVHQEIQRVRLTINDQKTDRAKFPEDRSEAADSAIQYLGFTYNGKTKLLRLSSLNRYYGKMRNGVVLAKQTLRKHNRLEALSNVPLSKLRRRKLYLQYSYLIKRRSHLKNGNPKAHGNFLTYVYRASDKLGSPEIKLQIRNHWRKLQEAIKEPIRNQLREP